MTDPCPAICLALVWHQHQPYYWDLSSRELVFPWVRLHATKDYCDMASRLEGFPEVRQTFNLVPSLLEQLEAYADESVTDRYLQHSRIPARKLTREQKNFLLERFFDAQEENLIRPYPRYAELKQRRDSQGVDRARDAMSPQDFLDLQTWFNLAWIDPWLRESDPAMRGLVAKGRGFSEEDKHAVLARHLDLVREVVPIHRRLQDAGQIEVTTTPFFHPILPLLCDSNEARVALPTTRLPSNRFRRPEDAREQVDRAVRFYEQTFGRRPRGMWPAEGAVSPAAAALFAGAGIDWIATDEEILGMSLGKSFRRSSAGVIEDPKVFYTPYRLATEAGEIRIVFRDHALSDVIGFHYHRAEPADAAKDFIARIESIARSCGPPESLPPLVTVILDGENCWEYYREDGHPFLDALYRGLSDHSSIRCVTVSGYLDEARKEGFAFPELPRLFSGSWINHSFAIWIGDDEDNRSWDLLFQAREALAEAARQEGTPVPELEKAWKELYVAEGSDWNWWYGREHHTIFAEAFDQLYRRHLRNVYSFIGREPPASLEVPIWKGEEPKIGRRPARIFTPVIDGRMTNFYEWCEAGQYRPVAGGEAMHAGQGRLRWLHFGFDQEHLFVRADFRSRADFPRADEELALLIHDSEPVRVIHLPGTRPPRVRFERRTAEGWREEPVAARAALDMVWEIAVPWSALPKVEPGQKVSFVVQILREGMEVERAPRTGAVGTVRPTATYDDEVWQV